MKPVEYQHACMRTARSRDTDYLTMNGVLGLTGEAGEVAEVADMIKKWRYQGHEMDYRKLAEELGDCLWYIATMAQGIGYDLEHIMEMNIAKLKRRYPAGFDPLLSINREEAE